LRKLFTGQGSKKKKSKSFEEEFVVRAAVRSLGQIGSHSSVPTLISALQDETNSIGNPTAKQRPRSAQLVTHLRYQRYRPPLQPTTTLLVGSRARRHPPNQSRKNKRRRKTDSDALALVMGKRVL
jgi:hypothetical protein